ncbi:PADRE domain [Dillenia turbinata]|uniref:PADRE domain n=1 Tax=Dillenia turbinata TaxID=194707 RepID=A0AAN8V720_9MAGN
MGNCQAAEAATVVLERPGDRVQRIYWSVSANEVMNSNPGHYVALVLTSNSQTENGVPVKHLKLLRPDDSLLIGHVYRLVSFEDVLKEFAAKRSVKLGRLIKESGLGNGMHLCKERIVRGTIPNPSPKSETSTSAQMEQEISSRRGSSGSCSSGSSSSRGGMGRHHGGVGQWKPALQSISEFGT